MGTEERASEEPNAPGDCFFYVIQFALRELGEVVTALTVRHVRCYESTSIHRIFISMHGPMVVMKYIPVFMLVR